MKWTSAKIRNLKGERPFACLTAYDFTSAKLVDRAGLPLILVGDSLGMTVLGHESTLPVTLDDMVHHTKAVVRGTTDALVVADMPFLTYQISIEEALRNAGRFLQEAGADAVKIEGGRERMATVESLVQNGIPVMGHIGLTPQSVKEMGYKVQGRSSESAERLLRDAKALEESGVFAIVLEACPAGLAKQITEEVSVPTIGIGAGAGCDGQILVFHDILGMFTEFTPKFVKQYATLSGTIDAAFKEYAEEVSRRTFPADEHTYG